MIRGVSRVILFAKDMEKVAAFYRDILGLEPRPSEHPPDEWLPLATGGECVLALHGIGAEYRNGIEIADPPDARHGSPAKIVLRVDDATKARDELAAKGVRFANEASLASDPLVRFDVLDPEGNLVQLSQE
jgi:catechol 2,3-dioxygenase-like lactoylglutathione lyase family enzyme